MWEWSTFPEEATWMEARCLHGHTESRLSGDISSSDCCEFFSGSGPPLVWLTVHFCLFWALNKDSILTDSILVHFQCICLRNLINLFALKTFWCRYLVWLVDWLVGWLAFGSLKAFWSTFYFEGILVFVLVFTVFEMLWFNIIWPLTPDIPPQMRNSDFFLLLLVWPCLTFSLGVLWYLMIKTPKRRGTCSLPLKGMGYQRDTHNIP